MKGTPQTVVRGFRHDMLIRGEPCSQAPMVKSGEHAEWLEGEVAKAYQRGHYIAGEFNWGSPAFRVFSGAARKPRMVIDYRRVNRLTVRAIFLMPDAIAVKRAAAGHEWYSTGDGVAGFNQILNTEFAQRVLAVVTVSGKHLPQTLGFGPSNGPEDFSRFGFRIFRRKLFRTWHLFVDDVMIASGKTSLSQSECEDGLAGFLEKLDAVQPAEAKAEEPQRGEALQEAFRNRPRTPIVPRAKQAAGAAVPPPAKSVRFAAESTDAVRHLAEGPAVVLPRVCEIAALPRVCETVVLPSVCETPA